MNTHQEHDKDMKKLLDEGFRSIDGDIDDSTPSLQWFNQFVQDQQEQLKERFKRDFILFLMAACGILAVFSLTLFQMPILFLLLQVAIFVGATVYTVFIHTKKVKGI
ncbi:YxlC family protein [Bacillus sp. RO3]|nr:YxlC family protein [Bacillus sp. RO3]